MSAHLTITSFEPVHADALCLRPGAVAALAGLPPLGELARVYQAAGPAWTVLSGAAVVACGGVVRFWPGVGECWCWTGVEVDNQPVAFARLVRRVVEALADEHCFHRLQLHTRRDDAQAGGFARYLGFTLEGACPGFGPDKSTHNLYGRFRWKE